MKNLKKVFKKLPKKAMAIFLVMAMTLQYFAPYLEVWAASTDSVSISFRDNYNTEQGYVEYTLDDGANWTKVEENVSGRGITTSGNNFKIRIVAKSGYQVDFAGIVLSLDGTAYSLNNNSNGVAGAITGSNGYQVDSYVKQVNLEAVEFKASNNQGGEDHPVQPGENSFDGKAYLIWSCGNGTCYHYFEKIPNFDNGNSTFYRASDITADNNSSISFDLNASNIGWALKEDFDRFVQAYKSLHLGTINWSTVNPSDIIGDPRNMSEWENRAISSNSCTKPAENASGSEWTAFERCVDDYAFEEGGILPFIKLQPLGEPTYNNSYVSYGDRNFKIVIYNNNYKGVTIGSLDELSYYPSTWNNPFLKRDQYDISGTTKNNPTVIDTILLEKVVKIKEIDVNNFSISKIEALDVPADAVSISKENGEWKLEFSSNFYDNVVFKVTDSNGGESCIQIKRYTVDAWIRFDNNRPVLTADFYFDRTKSYTDFDLTAKIVYKDGTTKNVSLTAKYGIDDGLGNITRAYEVDEENPQYGDKGKGLKKSTFEFALQNGEDRNISRVYLNAEYKGSTASNYAGAYVGSGEGTLANIYQGEEE